MDLSCTSLLSFVIVTNQGWVIGGPCSFTPSPAEPSNQHPFLPLLPNDHQQTTPERKPFSRSTDQVPNDLLSSASRNTVIGSDVQYSMHYALGM